MPKTCTEHRITREDIAARAFAAIAELRRDLDSDEGATTMPQPGAATNVTSQRPPVRGNFMGGVGKFVDNATTATARTSTPP